jgi:hypothetical protein
MEDISTTKWFKIYAGDKIVAILWACDPSTIPPHNGKGFILKGMGPLFDLRALQNLLRSGQMDLGNDQHCWVATDACLDHLENLTWTTGNQVRSLLLALRPGKRKDGGDFINAQWCADSDGVFSACDSYEVAVDETDNFRRDKNGLIYYIKFSLDEAGSLYLVLIQCHLKRYRERN